MKYPDYVFTHYHSNGTHIYHPCNQYTWSVILRTAKSLVKEGKAKNLWIGEDTIQYDSRLITL